MNEVVVLTISLVKQRWFLCKGLREIEQDAYLINAEGFSAASVTAHFGVADEMEVHEVACLLGGRQQLIHSGNQ